MKKAFTLIELLIVVAIIAILAAIAVPNFLEAQARSKVSRAKADLRTVGVGLEAYRLDFGGYPLWPKKLDGKWPSGGNCARCGDYASAANPFIGYSPPMLTTPVAYLTTLPREAFSWTKEIQINPNPQKLYFYDSITNADHYYGGKIWAFYCGSVYRWAMASVGPDGYNGLSNDWGPTNNIYEIFQKQYAAFGVGMYYNPTNGTTSWGDIIHYGPGGGFEYSATDAWR